MRVERKKNSTSRHFSTGRIASAYAHGTASSSTSTVEPIVAHAEFSSAVPMPPSKTALYCSSVGLKISLGVSVNASRSCLNDVSTIQKTGKDRPSAAIHPSPDQLSPLRDFMTSPPSHDGGTPPRRSPGPTRPRLGRSAT